MYMVTDSLLLYSVIGWVEGVTPDGAGVVVRPVLVLLREPLKPGELRNLDLEYADQTWTFFADLDEAEDDLAEREASLDVLMAEDEAREAGS